MAICSDVGGFHDYGNREVQKGSRSLSEMSRRGSRSLSKMSSGQHKTYIIAYFCLQLVVSDPDDIVHSFCHPRGALLFCVKKFERVEGWWTVVHY